MRLQKLFSETSILPENLRRHSLRSIRTVLPPRTDSLAYGEKSNWKKGYTLATVILTDSILRLHSVSGMVCPIRNFAIAD